MQCREFQEISESYLNDELLVETNHQINQHLEHCSDCRADFAARQRLQKSVASAGRNALEFQISPAFSNKLEAALRDEAMRAGFFEAIWLKRMMLIPAMALLLLAAGIGVVYLSRTSPDRAIAQILSEASHFAAGNHNDCALEKLGMWEAMSATEYPEKQYYSATLVEPLRSKYSDKIEMLSAHECDFEGKRFTHVVFRSGGKIVSLLVDQPNSALARNASQNAIVSEVQNGLQVASFVAMQRAAFVVSDLPESDNLKIAHTISRSLN
jgi:hypothetical protein